MTINMGRARRFMRRTAGFSAAAFLALAVAIAGDVHADPEADAMAKLEDLSRQALDARKAVTAAQFDADAKLAAKTAAEDRLRADLGALEAANAQLAPLQAVADRIAAMTYMGGGTGRMSAVLTAASPQQVIDKLSIQRAVTAATADQMREFQVVRDRAAEAAKTSEMSAAQARAAAEQSAAVRADLQGKSKELQRQIAAAEAQFAALTPQQQVVVGAAAAAVPPPPPDAAQAPVDPAIVAMPGEPPPEVLPEPALARADVEISEALPVGVANERGMQLNTILVARAISARYPQIATIDGVRPDSKPWHPNGLAIDIMVPNPTSPEGIALGNDIRDFVMSNAARFGMQDVIWRGTYYTPDGPSGSGYGHFDHVHVTTLPRR